MTILRNYLPQSISGEMTSSNKEILFCKDSNYKEEYEMQSLSFTTKFISDRYSWYKSINDYPTCHYPKTVVYGTTKTPRCCVVIERNNIGTLITRKLIDSENIGDSISDQYACLIDDRDKENIKYYYICNKNSNVKYFYIATDTNQFEKITTAFNTKDGTEGNTGIQSMKMFVVEDNYLLCFGGIDMSGIRYYYFDFDSKKLEYIGTLTEKDASPYQNYGSFHQLNKNQIYGMNSTHNSTTGKSYVYTFKKIESGKQLQLECEQHHITQTDGTIDICTNISPNYCNYQVSSFFNQKPHVIIYYPFISSGADLYRNLLMSKNGFNFINTSNTLISYDYEQEPDRIESLDFSTALWINQLYIKKVVLSDNGKSILIIELTQLERGKSVVFKIPGMPIVYVDKNVENPTEKPVLYYSKLNYMPMMLPVGSTVNGAVVKDNLLVFPQSGSVDIHPSSATLNKTFYCSRNNQGGFTL